jgi:hypothetical protein
MARSIGLILPIAILICEGCANTRSQRAGTSPNPTHSSSFRNRNDLNELIAGFGKFTRDDSSAYRIRLCADVPYDKNPAKVLYKKEPGHVFLVFLQVAKRDTVSHVFGYYPVRPASVIFGKNVRSQIRNNAGRIYDAHISIQLGKDKFFSLLDSSIVFARKKYNLNRFNCYDYAVTVFNLGADSTVVPLKYVKYPFIWGKGGSPTGLYSQLKALSETDPFWAQYLQFGQLRAPE